MYKLHFYMNLCFCLYLTAAKGGEYIDNFAENGDISQWTEHSDTVKNLGKSKASLVLQKTATLQRGVLFTLLNPQPCGAAFAGVRKNISVDLSTCNAISLKIRGQGYYKGYKLILTESGKNYSFCSLFEAPDDFKTVLLPLSRFKPYYEGKLIDNPKIRLDRSKIASIGIQAYGGVYLPTKQSGVASLEIDWIKSE